MHEQSIKDEAEACRALARRYAGRAEEPFLLKLADTFDELALVAEPRVARRQSSST